MSRKPRITTTTTAHAVWAAHGDDTPATGIPLITTGNAGRTPAADLDSELAGRMRQLMEPASTPPGDPRARVRVAAALHRLTGWDVFAEDADAERAYVSRLWVEDWDSPEDSVYDDQ